LLIITIVAEIKAILENRKKKKDNIAGEFISYLNLK